MEIAGVKIKTRTYLKIKPLTQRRKAPKAQGFFRETKNNRDKKSEADFYQDSVQWHLRI